MRLALNHRLTSDPTDHSFLPPDARSNERSLAFRFIACCLFGCAGFVTAQEPATLTVSKIKPGDVYRVSTKSALTGYLEVEDANKQKKRIEVTGNARVVYRERALAADHLGNIDRVIRLYDQVEYARKVGTEEKKGGLRDSVRRVVFIRKGSTEVPYSPDGPLQWPEVEVLGTHEFVALLEGFLPAEPLKQGGSWEASQRSAAELTGLNPIEGGQLTCTYVRTMEHNGASLGQIGFHGTLQGTTPEGRSRDKVNGAIYIDMATKRFSSLRAMGESDLLGKDGSVIGKLNVDYQIIVTPVANDSTLSDEAVRDIPEKPSDRQTDLTYDNPILNVRLRHPRRWFLSAAKERQIRLESGSASLVIYIEKENKSPTTPTFFDEVQTHLGKSQTKTTTVVPIEERSSPGGPLGHFRLEATLDGKPTLLDYWVVVRGGRGATIAARVLKSDFPTFEADLEQIAANLEFITPTAPTAAAPVP